MTTVVPAAPGSSTPEGRLEALDVMGIERQLIFPQVVLREYNDAVLRRTKAGNGRLRPTALLNLTTIDGAIAEAERGGTDPIGRMAADIEPLGADAVEAFFVGNAELLLPS